MQPRPACGGAVRIIACIEDPEVIEQILTHLDGKGGASEASQRPSCRAPLRRGCSSELGHPMITTRCCDASGTATVAGWVRAPGGWSEALRGSDQLLTVGADERQEEVLSDEKRVYTAYTRPESPRRTLVFQLAGFILS